MRFGAAFAPTRFLGEGWSHPEPNQTWAVGDESWIMLPCAGIADDCFLTLQVLPHLQAELLPRQRLALHANGQLLANFTVDRPMTICARIPAAIVAGREALCLRLVHPDNASPSEFPNPRHPDRRKLAIAYTEMTIAELSPEVQAIAGEIEASLRRDAAASGLAAPGEDMPDVNSLNRVFSDFQSIGDDCEFGMMQRRVSQGGDIGLFRFSSVPLNALIAGLQRDFADIAETEHLTLLSEENPKREFIGLETKYGMRYHTGRVHGEIGVEELKRKEVVRLRFLARKLMEDVRGGEKILVVKRKIPLAPEEIARLLSVLRGLGQSTVLWVAEAEPGRPAGSAEWVTRDLLRGYLEWIDVAPLQNTDLKSWARLCVAAHRLWSERQPQVKAA